MEIKLCLGGVVFLFCAERSMIVNSELFPFIVDKEKKADVMIQISWDWENVRLPRTNMIGQDAILNYYDDGDMQFCIMRGGPKGAIACVSYKLDFEKILCTINERPFIQPPQALGSVLRMLPMRQIFQYFKILFLHASQISYQGRGILFTGSSGIGKSTQAKLWKKYRGAEILCNDRTLTRKIEGGWLTYGYPLDGSEPVGCGQVKQLACVVLLAQGLCNEVKLLRPSKAINLLMRQVVMDTWNGEARTQAMELIIKLLEDIPVYLLTCTPDERAVETLEIKLMQEGVISDGKNFGSPLE